MTIIQDISGNPFITQVSPMIGFVEPNELATRDLSLNIYKFIIESIRTEDQLHDAFVERFLNGPQIVWEVIDSQIKNIPKLWSITEVNNRFLDYIKWIVGWTSELDHITNRLDDQSLRRLIASSVPFWKKRGTEDAIKEILRLVTGSRIRIWNWFDLRWVLDETLLSEDNEGYDPYMISLPGPPDYDEQRYNIRIVDNGSLDKTLVADIVKLTRPSCERVEISYLGFLDLFVTDGDASQWETVNSLSNVSNGFLTLSDLGSDAEAYVNLSDAEYWYNYTVTWRIKGEQSFCCEFYRTASTDKYEIIVCLSDHISTPNTIIVAKKVAGVQTIIDSVDMMTTYSTELFSNIFYSIRVVTIATGVSTNISVCIDSEQIFNITDTSHSNGSIGIIQPSGSVIELSEVEMFFNPLECEWIDINS